MLPPKAFHFIRHGETDWNIIERLQGRTDIPLNATGLAQAQQAIPLVTGLGLTHIISSPLQRAHRTAEILNSVLQLPLQLDDNLQERHFGSFEGRTRAEILAAHNLPPTGRTSDIMPPDSESWDALKHRATTVMHHWLTQLPAASLLFVGHGAFATALGEVLLGHNNLRLPNAQPMAFAPSPNGWQVTTLASSQAA
jgi:broad specificity phosphatase PhoE